MDDQKIKAELLEESIDWIKKPGICEHFWWCLGKTNKVEVE